MRTAWIALVMIACEGKGAAPPATGSSEPPRPAPSAIDAAMAVAVPDAAPARPPLGPPPAGMDAAQAKACEAGDASGCVAAANSFAPRGAYRANLSAADADAKALGTTRYAQRGCELGDGAGCALVAQFGAGRSTDGMLVRACELGYAASCGSVGRSLIGSGRTVDRQRGADLLEKACVADAVDWMSLTSHHGGFCHQLYEAYKSRSLRNRTKARRFLALACRQGDKLDCPCKVDADCGELPDDEAGLGYFCASGTCQVASSE